MSAIVGISVRLGRNAHATFLASSHEPMRLIVSPFISPSDQQAIRLGVQDPEQRATEVILGSLPDAGALVRHTLACLTWLIREGRLHVRIALMKDALFHTKAWIFRDGSHAAALHGSSNMTRAGLTKNREQVTLSRSWKGEESQYHIARLQKEFDELWEGGDESCIVIDMPRALKDSLLREFLPGQMPTEAECTKLWRRAVGLPEVEPEEIAGDAAKFTIPPWLKYREGEYAHQGKAVDAWRASRWQGVLEMATGSGKTIAALIGAHELHAQLENLFVVVAAPYRPLIEQWCDEIELFGLRPINLTHLSGANARDRQIKQLGRRLRMGISDVEVVVVSNDTLCTSEFIDSVSSLPTPKLLIADECHNLGAAAFIASPPECFNYRLGLSATPIRQYDEEGTEALFGYFGDVCFQYTLEDAIGKCLTPYNYYVHFVELTPTEMGEWSDLTEQISRVAWKFESGSMDSHLENLLRRRRLVLETASGKIASLKKLLDAESREELRYTLVYATDKDPQQLVDVNRLLSEKGLLFHQLTYEETADREVTAGILARFQAGELQVLSAKRVLDEGVNVPQIKKAFILASTTVKRQWVQRRGRLLRICKEINKTHADIHDLVTLPPSNVYKQDRDARKIVKGELDRVWEFARLCQNGAAVDGPFSAVQYMQQVLGEGGD